MQTWTFKDYQEYQAYQKRRAKRTRGITRRHAGLRLRIMELLKAHCPRASTVLCLGARSRVEVEHFQSAGFQAEGIDLCADGPVYACDMSDLDGDERYRNRSFDVFVLVHSLEHCLDFPGFQKRSLPHCLGAVAVAIPCNLRSKLTAWDCVAFDFQNGDESPEAIERYFPDFRLVHREVMQSCLVFLLCRGDKNS
jgi:hypothetical protein